MATCPHCQKEYAPKPGQRFCEGCGKPLERAPAAAGPVSEAREAAAPGTAIPETAIPEPRERPAPLAGTAGATGNVKVQGVGEGITAGGNVTVTTITGVEFCAAGHEKLFGDRETFLCPECHKYPVCERHFDRDRGLCSACAEGPKVVCAVCNQRLPAGRVFMCRRCRRIVGDDHQDPKREEWCAECSAQWAGMVEAMEQDEVGISMGTVVGRDDVELKGKVLQTKDGKPVATIKKNIWYAKPKQWYLVKPGLLHRERQAMGRFYPNFQMGTTPEGDRFWQGAVTTWTGNDYEVQLHYPASFPKVPPKAYVLNPKILQSRHIYPDGHLCLFHKDDRSWEPTTTAAVVMSWVSLWLHCYEVWLETGNWPRPEHDDVVITTSY